MAPDDPDEPPGPSAEVIAQLLTHDRLQSYLASTTQDLEAAVGLYEWNLVASAAVLHTVAMIEVVVRNALDAQLMEFATHHRASDWLDIAPLDARGREDVAKAIRRAEKSGKSDVAHGKVVAEFSLGFWRYLLASRYHASLWVPYLHGAFPHGPSDLRTRRRAAEERMDRLLTVRNRAAHHEPIHRRDLMRDFTAAAQLSEWIHPVAGAWVVTNSWVPGAVSARPTTPL